MPEEDPEGAAVLRREHRESSLGTMGASKGCSWGSRSPRSFLLPTLFSLIHQRLQHGALIPKIKLSF